MFRSVRDRQSLSSASSSVNFQQQFGQSVNLIHRLKLDNKLEGHDGCVNTVAFTPSGDALVSGSDDLHINIWDWQSGTSTLKFHSGHRNNVFQAKTLPHSADKTIVTCAADGQVRAAFISEDGHAETKKLAKHNGRAHKLALEADQPQCFLSSGEDGAVLSFDLRTRKCTKLLACKQRIIPGGDRPLSLNSIHCNPARPWQFAVAGGDQFVRVYDRRKAASVSSAEATASEAANLDNPIQQNKNYAAALATPVRKLTPQHLRSPENFATPCAHITCANFSRQGEIVATYNDENIYLFAPEGSRQDRGRARPSSGSPSSPVKRARTAESDDAELQLDDEAGQPSGKASSSHTEQHMPLGGPVTGPQKDDEVLQRFRGHLNSDTVKGVSFMGVADEFVVSGSDCGHVFVWSKEGGKLQKLVKGDRHVVNCLEPHPFLPATLATSGIDHDIKLWSPTAEEAHPPGEEAEEIMENNCMESGPRHLRERPVRISSQMIAQILSMQHLPIGRAHRRQEAASSDQDEEGSEGDDHDEGEHEDEDGDEEARAAAERRQECVIS